MADDDEVRLTIRVTGSLTAEPLLKRAMSEQGVQVLSSTGRGPILNDLGSAVEVAAAIVTVVQGGQLAVKAGLALFRRWNRSANVEVEDESGNKLEGYL